MRENLGGCCTLTGCLLLLVSALAANNWVLIAASLMFIAGIIINMRRGG